uniref:EF-hand domain-containing protein n=1 Tax=Knipowitschia caucasica TaxID=637954 RepID=A0AAV2LG09_KNICA
MADVEVIIDLNIYYHCVSTTAGEVNRSSDEWKSLVTCRGGCERAPPSAPCNSLRLPQTPSTSIWPQSADPCRTPSLRDQGKRLSQNHPGGLGDALEPTPITISRYEFGSRLHFLAWREKHCELIFILTQERSLADDEIDELRDAFNEFDKDKDGLITCKDLGNLMRTMGYMPTEMELIELSQNINMNLGGRVDFEDFVDLMTPKLLAETSGMIGMKELKDAFKEFDMDGDGEITTEELRSAMCKLMGEHMSRKEIDTIVKEADDNGDGTVDFEEFVKMMMMHRRGTNTAQRCVCHDGSVLKLVLLGLWVALSDVGGMWKTNIHLFDPCTTWKLLETPFISLYSST